MTDGARALLRVAWRRTPALVVLAVLALAGLFGAAAAGELRIWVLGTTIAILDLAGAVYSWRAAPLRPTGTTPWRLIAAGRLGSTCTGVFLAFASFGATEAWWWAAATARMLMFLLVSAGVLMPVVTRYDGRARAALIAETATVLAAGFMVIWYFVLEPVRVRGRTASIGIVTIGWPLGEVLMLAAVASIVLRGVISRFAGPVAVLTGGLTLYLVADVFWMAGNAEGNPVTSDIGVLVCIVLASLLMTAGPILAIAHSGRAFVLRTTRPPAWATHLPMAAIAVGCLLMLTVTLLEGEMMTWGGLVCGLIVMTCAATLRQWLSLRQSRDRLIADALTGLANRAGLDEALDRTAKRGEAAAILLIDLDGFKLVNDAYGHAAGDAFLAHVGRLLRSAVRNGDVCARIGGDEFAILLTDIGSDEAVGVAQRVLTVAAENPVGIEDDVIPVRASVGVAHAERDYDAKTLLRHADTAMYHSKRAGSHSYACWTPAMVDHRAADAALAEDLQQALRRGELHVLYQPMIDLASGRPVAAEALLRWQHPVHGLVSPVRFIPIAERTAAITEIGLWVLEQALSVLPDRPSMYISVNLSPRQLREPTVVHDILAVLDRTGVTPRRLVLEITESALVDDSSGIAALRAFREHGIRIAIDDFGTGYSSLQYLTRLPVDILKIDRAFVAELNGSPEGSAVAEAIIRLAEVLHLTTVAEGVETEQQVAELRALGCVTGQGYLFAKPLTAETFSTFITSPVRAKQSTA
ncbi:EAL domain-containing protein [Actinoplanes sp. NPDC051851]|uniref:putative bifunctional diguanylate cyclase/phosphodiesterase n=1 Tax=Actinoplanes sp. NPDC051851 TaxID=3154753 RepID=UPI00343545FD